jgi:purine-nucleoside phosphorylase
MKDIHIKDIIVGTGASTDSNYGASFKLNGTISAIPDFNLLKKCDEKVKELKLEDKVKFGQFLSTDVFYGEGPETLEWPKMGVIAVEMEAYALYLNAARAGKRALCICAVSDNLVSKEVLSSEEREKSVNDMIQLALETAICFE